MNQIIDFIKNLFDSSDWPPRWHCGRWTEFHGWLYIISDLLIWSAYFSIPVVIIDYISKRKDVKFLKLYFLFAAFILACGATHFLDAIAFWIPVYRLNALVRLITGVLSWITVFYLVKLLPVAFSLKSQKELEKAEDEIRQLNEKLELRVLERTDELYRNEKKYRNLFENNPMPMWVIDLATYKFLDVNEAAIIHYGYRREEFLSMTALDIRPEEDINYFKQAAQTENTNLTDYKKGIWKHVKKDGTIIHAEVVGHDIFYEGKKARFTLSNDISSKIHVEEKLIKTAREIEDYKYALDESSIVAITDQKGIIKHVNENFCKISKYNADELIGQDHRIINSSYHPKEFIQNLWVTIANGKIWRGELRNRAKDGTIYWVDTTIIPFLNDQGKPYQYVAIRADISDRKLVEEELKKLNEELEDRVNLRTIQLEAANKEMEAFTYSVSHDLRAPLRGIIGFATILEEDYSSKLDEEAKRITGIIKHNTQRMGRLIDDLLAFSRIGRQDITKTNIATRAMVEEVIGELYADNNRPIEWNVQDLPFIKGDVNTMRQVWVNLISNAIKYSGTKEHPYIEIGHFIHEGQMAFFIRDNGVGFDNKYKDKLFKVFQRLHGADQFEGTGVGLALVEKIIFKHGGRVWADAEKDKGACFYFSLPAD